ncbi:MAG: PHP domain-containing protein [Desulfatiglandales bacterium]
MTRRIDLHIHSRDCSDGRLGVKEIVDYAKELGLSLLSITDHDAISCQEMAMAYAQETGMGYITGVEISIRYRFEENGKGWEGSLDILGYGFDPLNERLNERLNQILRHRKERIEKTFQILNSHLQSDGLQGLEESDLLKLEKASHASLGRPLLADLLVEKGYVRDRKEAFIKYLDEINLPKFPIGLKDASGLIRDAGGKVVLAHPADPSGNSLRKFYPNVERIVEHIDRHMLPYLDGLECWHSRQDEYDSEILYEYAKGRGLLSTGGSDCHQSPLKMGSVDVPQEAIDQFIRVLGRKNGS